MHPPEVHAPIERTTCADAHRVAGQPLIGNLRRRDAAVAAHASPDHAESTVAAAEAQAHHGFAANTTESFRRPPRPAWCTLGGVFTNRYVPIGYRWCITACRSTLRWCTGDGSPFDLARQRR